MIVYINIVLQEYSTTKYVLCQHIMRILSFVDINKTVEFNESENSTIARITLREEAIAIFFHL